MSKSNPYAAPSRGHQKPVETPETDTAVDLHVPDGTIAEVLEWVGDDQERAARALDHESKHHARKSLIETLSEKLTAGDPSALVPSDAKNAAAEESSAGDEDTDEDE